MLSDSQYSRCWNINVLLLLVISPSAVCAGRGDKEHQSLQCRSWSQVSPSCLTLVFPSYLSLFKRNQVSDLSSSPWPNLWCLAAVLSLWCVWSSPSDESEITTAWQEKGSEGIEPPFFVYPSEYLLQHSWLSLVLYQRWFWLDDRMGNTGWLEAAWSPNRSKFQQVSFSDAPLEMCYKDKNWWSQKMLGPGLGCLVNVDFFFLKTSWVHLLLLLII